MQVRLPCDAPVPISAPAGKPEGARARWALVAAVLGSTLASLDANGVNVALPTLQREFSTTPAAVQWIVEAYALFLASLILAGGALADRFGRRRIFAAGTLIFGVASLACGLAPGIGLLILARSVQGAGAALMVPGSLALISAAYPGASKGSAIGLWAGASAVAGAAGPPLSGWLTQSASWRWIFLVNVPLALLVAVMAMVLVDESFDFAAPRNFDWRGAALATLGLGGLTAGFVQLQSANADRSLSIGMLAAGCAILASFARMQITAAQPMVPRELTNNSRFIAANLYTFVLYGALGGALYFVPFDLQFVRGYSPFASGAALLPFVAVMAGLSRLTGGFFAGERAVAALVLGPVAVAIGLLFFAFGGTGAPYWATFFPGSMIMGLGAALFVAPLTTTVMDTAAGHAGAGSGVNNAVARSAGLLAVAVVGTLTYVTLHAAVMRSISSGAYSPQARIAVESHFDQVAALEVPSGVPSGERERLHASIREDYARAFAVAMAACAAGCLAASLYAGSAMRAGRVAAARRRATP